MPKQKSGIKNESFEMGEMENGSHSHSDHSAKRATRRKINKKKPGSPKARFCERSIEANQGNGSQDGILEIIIYRTDRLKVGPSTRHLFVRIHIMDTEREDYIKCDEKISGPVEEHSAYVLPVKTKLVNTKYQDLLMPVWDEIIIINESFRTFASNKNVILFFEILDSTENIFGRCNNENVKTSCGRNIGSLMTAWAFLLLTNSNGQLNAGPRKQRLQLYEPIIKTSTYPLEKLGNLPVGKMSSLSVLQKHQLLTNASPNLSEYNAVESGYHLLSCWKSGSRYRVPYPSSLYVTIKETVRKTSLEKHSGDKMDSNQNISSQTKQSEIFVQPNINLGESALRNILLENENSALIAMSGNELNELQKSWTRKSHQPCRIPNILVGYGITTCIKTDDNFEFSLDMGTNKKYCASTKSSGAQCLAFSPDGKWLAVGVIRNKLLDNTTGTPTKSKTNKMDCSVLIYKFPFDNKRSQPNLELAGHSDIIYSVDWAKTPVIQNHNNKSTQKRSSKDFSSTKIFWILASGSADGTVRVWRLHFNQVYENFTNDDNFLSDPDTNIPVPSDASKSQFQVGQIINGLSHKKGILCNVLGHPNFVYSVAFKPLSKELALNDFQVLQTLVNQDHLLATACYDRVVRLWSIKHNETQLLQELNGVHQSHINSLTFDTDGSRIYSGDALGLIVIWKETNNEQRKQVKCQSKWIFEKKIEVRELEMCIINHLEFHPTLNLLLVHTRDNCPKMLDLRSNFITTRFHGALNNTELLRSCISPCGSFLFSGSEDQNVYVWNVNTGDKVACYQNLQLPGSVTSISYHPMDNVIAFAAVGPDSPIAIYAYNIKANQLTTLSQNINEEKLPVYEEELNNIEQPPDILASHVKFKQRDTERVLLAMSKLESVLNVSKPLARYPQNNLHELEWRPTFTVIDEVSDQQSTVDKLDSVKNAAIRTQTSDSTTNIFTALYDYQAQRSDELNFKRGDKLKILYKDTPRWWMAKLVTTGQQGFAPANYISEDIHGEDNDNSQQLASTNKPNPSNLSETHLKHLNLSEEQILNKVNDKSGSVKNNNLRLLDSGSIDDNINNSENPQTRQSNMGLSNIDIKPITLNSGSMKKRKSSARPLPTLN
uniref:SH3 domain-containing protein n=1 Tax=Schistosoma mansoni TaxID=6183 RepID=A0A5K4FC79_SCHMA